MDQNNSVIAVFGASGTGKSTFIDCALGGSQSSSNGQTLVGHKLGAYTKSIQTHTCVHPTKPGHSVTFVDTPGFDASDAEDFTLADALSKIATYLSQTYKDGQLLSGILYFHRISDNRMGSNPIAALQIFKKLCGTNALRHVVLVTTMWGHVSDQVGQDRETELKKDFWSSMLLGGSQHARFMQSCSSAWDIVDLLPGNVTELKIQTQIVNKKLPLHRTSAGQLISQWKHELATRLWKVMFSSSLARGLKLHYLVASNEIGRLRAHLLSNPSTPCAPPVGRPSVDDGEEDTIASRVRLPRTGDSWMSPLHAIATAIYAASMTCYECADGSLASALLADDLEDEGAIDESVVALARSAYSLMVQVYGQLATPGSALQLTESHLEDLQAILDRLMTNHEPFSLLWSGTDLVAHCQQQMDHISQKYEIWTDLNKRQSPVVSAKI